MPADIAELFELQEVYAGSNKLSEIPEGLCWCSNLQILSLPKNSLERLPVEFENLKKLTMLILSENEFLYVPAAFCALEELEVK